MENKTKKAKKIELLAPARDKELAKCAVDFGADSLYMGGNLFGARKNASNSVEDIKDVVSYAHKFNVKVYVTVNTILDDNELKRASELIERLDEAGVDGIIIQDMGLLNIKLPEIKLIASTQCDIRDVEKVKFFEKTGIQRVILARELPLKTIEEICKNTDIEVETFVHGALCVSYSGQCYLSSSIGGRSANRGDCAQACRKKYTLADGGGKVIAKDKYLLSLKDFCAVNYLENLIDAGVTSFKIEGRLKDENYIKNTVLFYRKALDKILENKGWAHKASSGKVFADFEPDISKSFNRGFCDYFLDGRKKGICNLDTPNAAGEKLGEIEHVNFKEGYIKLKNKDADIHPQDGLCYFDRGILKGFLVNSFKDGKIYPNAMPEIDEGCGAGSFAGLGSKDKTVLKAGCILYKNRDAAFEKILKNSEITRKIGVKFRVFNDKLEAEDEDGNTITESFSGGEKAKNAKNALEGWTKSLNKTGSTIFYTKGVEFDKNEAPFLIMSGINELRRRILEKLEDFRVKNYKRERQKPIKAVQYPQKQGDYRLNVHNKVAEEFYEKCGCKVLEYSFESRRGGGCPGGTGREVELMRTKHCIRYTLDMCLKENGAKNDKLFLIDEKGQKYPLIFDCAKCEMAVLGKM